MASQRRAEAENTRDHSPPTRNGEWKARKLAMASETRVDGEEVQRAKFRVCHGEQYTREAS